MNRTFVNRAQSTACCGIVAAVLWLIIDLFASDMFSNVSDAIGTASPGFLAFGTVALAGLMILSSVGGRWGGCRYFFQYPPLWVALVVAIFFLAASSRVHNGDWSAVTVSVSSLLWPFGAFSSRWWFWISLSVLAIGVWAWRWARAEPAYKRKFDYQGNEFQSLLKWVLDDVELCVPEQDRYGKHAEIASRIANRFTDQDVEEAPAIQLIGPKGAGKSSVCRLVQYELKQPSKNKIETEVIQLSLWQFESTAAATSGILISLVNVVSKHVSTLAFSGVADRYLDAAERISTTSNVIASLMRVNRTPEEVVNQVGEIAEAIGVRFILWIEDFERFTYARTTKSEYAQIHEAERMSPINSLLYLLDRTKGITVVMSDTTSRSWFDQNKLVRFVERMPAMDYEQVWGDIEVFRSACLRLPFIDPAEKGHRSKLQPPEASGEYGGFVWLWGFGDSPSIQLAMAQLTDTPRVLKDALRYTWDTWSILRGEIDFDCVLVISIMRAVKPNIIDFIEKEEDLVYNRRTTISAGLHQQTGEAEKRQANCDEFFKRLAKSLTDLSQEKQIAIRACIGYLFPEMSNQVGYVLAPPDCPQGFHNGEYWDRYCNPRSIPVDQSDQHVLRLISDWKQGEDVDLVSALIGEGVSKPIARFTNQFTSEDFLLLLEQLCMFLKAHSAHDWKRLGDVPGLMVLASMMRFRPPDSLRLREQITSIIHSVIEENVSLVHNLQHLFATSSEVRLLNEEDKNEVHIAVHSELLRNFVGKANQGKLLLAIRGAKAWSLFWTCWTLERIRKNDFDDLPFEGWSGFSDAILDAAEQDKVRGIAQIIPFVTSSNRRHDFTKEEIEAGKPVRVFTAMFDSDMAQRLFDYERLLKLLAKSPDHGDALASENSEAEIQIRLEAARNFARNWISGNGKPKDNRD